MNSQYEAHARYILISPTKVRRIADNIRMKKYTVASAILSNIPHKGAKILKKLLKSAASNALVQNASLDEEELFIKQLYVNEGPRIKRIWRRSRGRADVLLKRMSHISVVLAEVGSEEE